MIPTLKGCQERILICAFIQKVTYFFQQVLLLIKEEIFYDEYPI